MKPQLSEEAKAVLSDYFLNLRKQFQDGDSAPVTVRQLHSLIRLTQVIKQLTVTKYVSSWIVLFIIV